MTKLHQDMSDAVNILVHAQRANGEEAAVPRNGLDLASRDGGWVGMLMHIDDRRGFFNMQTLTSACFAIGMVVPGPSGIFFRQLTLLPSGVT